jgi:hypothetical protein
VDTQERIAVGEAGGDDVLTDDRSRPVQENGSHPQSRAAHDEFAGIDFVDTSSDVDYDAAAPKQVTAEMLNQFVAEHGAQYPEFPFKLTQLSIQMGETMTAQVRIINLTDRALIESVPVEVRNLVQKLFFAGSQQQKGKPNATQRMADTMRRVKETAYAYGCAGFVTPQLVLRPEDVKDPSVQAWVGSIPLHDLTEYVRICEGDDQLAKRRLEGFSL